MRFPRAGGQLGMGAEKPLVLDVDGTFLRTDLMLESLWAGLGRAPRETLAAVRATLGRPAAFRREVTRLVPPRVDLLPIRVEIAERALAASEAGREVVLVSGADDGLIDRLAGYYGFTAGLGADGRRDVAGEGRAAVLKSAFGLRGYDYAGDSAGDRAAWLAADRAVVVGGRPGLLAELQAAGRRVEVVPGGWRWRDLVQALRPHQWVKNVLLFLPVLAAHDFTLPTLLLVLLGMVAFSAAASCIYVVNDLLDLEADRLHPTKRNRPFAAGAVPIGVGMVASLLLGLLALGIGAALGWAFLGVLVLYMGLSLAYSLRLKRLRWVDIATLAALYTIRVLAGAAATGMGASILMLVFVFPVFLSLGCVKRMTELALVVFFAYSFSEQARALYPTRWLLWLALVPLAIWLIRMVILGHRGKQDYDPIVFALRDRVGLGLIFFALSFMFYGAGLWQRWFGF